MKGYHIYFCQVLEGKVDFVKPLKFSKKMQANMGIPEIGSKFFFLNLKNCSGRQMPPRGIGASNANRGYWGVKCHLGVLGRQMPPQITGASKARGVKGPKSLMASKIRGVKGPSMGRGRKGH